VQAAFVDDGVILTKTKRAAEISADYTHCPDLAQTIAVACAASGTQCTMTGLESLRIKETDRIFALQQELAKIGAQLTEEQAGVWKVIPSEDIASRKEPIQFATYEDHRMAMALAPLATQMDVVMEDPGVVNKSYPSFWKDLKKAGIDVQEK
jgi:3-phosphoshikimate 1-carboxyvinyltransferase